MQKRVPRRLLTISLFLVVFILISFGIVSALDIGALNDPAWIYRLPRWAAIAVSVGLLTADVLIPIPASLIMIANGAYFGIVGGTIVSLSGAMTSVFFGWYIGKAASKKLQRFIGKEDRTLAKRFMETWGSLAVIISRPIPVLSEAVSILCGTLGYSPGRMAWMSVIGYLPPTVIFSIAGAEAREAETGWISFLIVMVVSVVIWVAGTWLKSSAKNQS
jgi:uncharacterized membrane protein YdjX (TVP38/TMEM64 family)